MGKGEQPAEGRQSSRAAGEAARLRAIEPHVQIYMGFYGDGLEAKGTRYFGSRNLMKVYGERTGTYGIQVWRKFQAIFSVISVPRVSSQESLISYCFVVLEP